MAFDPNTIKQRKPLPEAGAGGNRVEQLATTLLGRGLASSMSSARRLAESMVETETKVMGQGPTRLPAYAKDRLEFQRSDSQLFKAVGGKAQRPVSFPEPFTRFIERATPMRASAPAAAPVTVSAPRPVEPAAPAPPPPGHIMFAEAPPPTVREITPQSVRLRPDEEREVAAAASQWKVPERDRERGYTKTMVESGPDGVVVRHVEATANSDMVVEEGVIRADAPPAAAPAAPERQTEDLAKKHNVDLFNIFKTK
jgi:hypothetical protein